MHLEPVVRPGAEFHDARLIVKGEISDVNRTSTPKLGWWWPEDVAVIADHGFAVHVAPRVIIGAVIW